MHIHNARRVRTNFAPGQLWRAFRATDDTRRYASIALRVNDQRTQRKTPVQNNKAICFAASELRCGCGRKLILPHNVNVHSDVVPNESVSFDADNHVADNGLCGFKIPAGT